MEGQLPRVQVGSILTCLLSDQLPPDFTREEYGAEICWAVSMLVLVFTCSNH